MNTRSEALSLRLKARHMVFLLFASCFNVLAIVSPTGSGKLRGRATQPLTYTRTSCWLSSSQGDEMDDPCIAAQSWRLDCTRQD
ncbi:hypothetical protein P171DRAFT_170569 [Karstenula rhodostoma CBS 690.94]|uniref:Uncharacterized protein n=1 Tax=Karstenula rhodostoma CBS 690.94 TaxID=1392251 RepID=A0A9P4P7R1_9PLEO|nr:hypothetical protein P171DRAFT_170569 [Karstenula rhodostoma CBS 690.94]